MKEVKQHLDFGQGHSGQLITAKATSNTPHRYGGREAEREIYREHGWIKKTQVARK